MKVFIHHNFERSYQKLPEVTKRKAEKRRAVFKKNPFDPRLDTHKLHGRLKKLWSFSVDEKYRIIFLFQKGDVIFLDIGDHSLYK